MSILKEIQPCNVFGFFEALTKIPRCSGHEQAVSDYLVKFAHDRHLQVKQDQALNVIIRKPGTPGYEHAPTVILQGHMDMVGEKTDDSEHNFATDPLTLVIDGDTIRADRTTLGADNGIGLAYGLAILDANDIPHPPLELLVTTNEETGMDGAAALVPGELQGKILLNIDTEEEGVFIVSCAGGINTMFSFDNTWDKASGKAVRVEVAGLNGGHSGLEIDKQRGNAIKILARILQCAHDAGEVQIADLQGGTKHNAIPRDAFAVITAQEHVLTQFQSAFVKLAAEIKAEYHLTEPAMTLSVTAAALPQRQLSAALSCKIIQLLSACPDGVQMMSNHIPGLVETSLNVAVLNSSDTATTLLCSLRSSVQSRKESLCRSLQSLASLADAAFTTSADYPVWEYNENSEISDLAVKTYQELTGKPAKVCAIHAGLECGILSKLMPDVDMISFGPNLYDVHTPKEHLSISSVATTFALLKNLLRELK